MWVTLSSTIPYWVLDYPDDPIGPSLLVAVYSVAAHVERPTSLHHGVAAISAILIVGTIGVLIPQEMADWCRDNLPECDVVNVGKGTHYIQEDCPGEIGSAIAEWMDRKGLASA